MSKDAMTRYEKRNKEDTVFMSFKATSDTTFDFNVWSNIPGGMAGALPPGVHAGRTSAVREARTHRGIQH